MLPKKFKLWRVFFRAISLFITKTVGSFPER